MSKTKIGWADDVWNPVLGCRKVSPGCDRCYAIVQAHMRAANPNPKIAAAFAGLTVATADGVDWTGRVNLLPERLTQPLRARRPRRWFVNSLSDLFHPGVPDAYIARVFGVMARCPRHTFIVLTKQQARMRFLLSDPGWVWQMRCAALEHGFNPDGVELNPDDIPYPLPNVHLGVSAENQQMARIRIPKLLATPAAVRLVSAEPLIEAMRLGQWLGYSVWPNTAGAAGGIGGQAVTEGPGIDWVITGGESGPGARPMAVEWARSLRSECEHTGVPLFFKQAGTVLAREWGCKATKGDDPAEWPESWPQDFPQLAAAA